MAKRIVLLLAIAWTVVAIAQTVEPNAQNQANKSTAERVQTMIEYLGTIDPVPGTPNRRIGTLYNSYMDTARIEALGRGPVQGDLERIDAAASKGDIAALYGRNTSIYAPLRTRLGPAPDDPMRYAISVGPSDLNLPDANLYLATDARAVHVREKYQAYVAQLLRMLGTPDPDARAKGVVAFEVELAKIPRSTEAMRGADANIPRWTRAELAKRAPGLDWEKYFTAQGLGRGARLRPNEDPDEERGPDRAQPQPDGLWSGVVPDTLYAAPPEALQAIARLVASTDLQVLKDQLAFSLISNWADVLPEKYYQAHFDFYGRFLGGEKKPPTREVRGARFVARFLPQDVGQAYVQRYVKGNLRADIEKLSRDFRKTIGAKSNTLGRVNTDVLVIEFGYPLVWPFRFELELIDDDAFGNTQRIREWDWRQQVERLDRPVDKLEWSISPAATQASFNPLLNRLLIPVALLQPPIYDPAAKDADNLTTISALLKQELAHIDSHQQTNGATVSGLSGFSNTPGINNGKPQ